MRQGGSEQELRLGESWDRSDLAVNPQRLPEEEAQHPTRDACNGNRSPTRGGGPLPPHSPDGGAAAGAPGAVLRLRGGGALPAGPGSCARTPTGLPPHCTTHRHPLSAAPPRPPLSSGAAPPRSPPPPPRSSLIHPPSFTHPPRPRSSPRNGLLR